MWRFAVPSLLPVFLSVAVTASEKSAYDRQIDSEPILVRFCFPQDHTVQNIKRISNSKQVAKLEVDRFGCEMFSIFQEP